MDVLGADWLIFPFSGADFKVFGADRLVFPPSGAFLLDFGAERQDFLPSGAEFGIIGAEGLPGLRRSGKGNAKGEKVGTILSKSVPEVARGGARDISYPSKKSSPIV